MRGAPLLLATILLAGCFGASTEPGAPAIAATLGAVWVEGASILSQNETSITFTWEGVASAPTTTPAGVVLFGAALDARPVKLPAGQHLRVVASMEWEGDADLDLYVRDANDAIACSSAADGDTPESCRAFVWQTFDAPAEWTVGGLAFSAEEDTPYTATLLVESAVPPDVGFDLSTLTKPVLKALPKVVGYASSSVDGTQLYMESYLPDGPGPWPTIFILSPYFDHGIPALGRGIDTEANLRNYYVPRGYAVVLGDVRGTGNSEGCYEMMGDLERQDAHDMVEWIAEQEWSDGKVGMWGVSYVGTTPHMAAVMAPEHLTTIVTVAGVTSQWRNMFLNGVPIGSRSYPTGYWTSQGVPPPGDIERGLPWVQNTASGYCTDPGGPTHVAPSTYEKGLYDEYWLERNQTELVANVNVPVFYSQGFADRLVTPEEALDWFNELPSPKKGFFHQGVHQLPPRADFLITMHGWFDHWLQGIDNGIERSNVVEVQLNDETLRRGDSWPPMDATPLRLYLSPETLGEDAPSDGSATYLANNGRTAIGGGVVPSLADTATGAAAETSLTFVSDPLDAPFHLAGVPMANLVASSSAENTYFLLSLYDVDGEEWTEITEGWMNAHLREGFDRSAPLTPGETYTFGFKFMPREYVVPEGHSIGIRILGYDPRVTKWDVPAAQNTVLYGAEGSWIELPTLPAPNVIPMPEDL